MSHSIPQVGVCGWDGGGGGGVGGWVVGEKVVILKAK